MPRQKNPEVEYGHKENMIDTEGTDELHVLTENIEVLDLYSITDNKEDEPNGNSLEGIHMNYIEENTFDAIDDYIINENEHLIKKNVYSIFFLPQISFFW